MNTLISRSLFLALMIFGAVNLGNTANLLAVDDGGEMVMIDKTGNSVLTISLAKDYSKTVETALISVTVGDQVLYSTKTTAPYLEIAGLKISKGQTFHVNVSIGEFHYSEELVW